MLKGAKADLLSDPPRFSDRGDRWNMDHVWFSEEEMTFGYLNMLLERAMNAPSFKRSFISISYCQ